MADTGLVVVVGAGIGGLAVALALNKVGIPVTVLEKADTLREEGASINLATNAWRAMEVLGIADTLRERFCRIERYVSMRETGQVLKEVRVTDCADGPHEIRGCVRNDLVRALADALPTGTVRLGCSVASADFSPEGCSVTLDSGEVIACRVLVGADGAYSKVKAVIGGPTTEYSGWSTYRGMAAFKDGIPNSGQDIPNFAQDFCLMTGGSQAAIAGLYPLDTQRCYYFFGFPVPQDEATKLKQASSAEKKADLAKRVGAYPKRLQEAVALTAEDDIFLNHIGDRVVEPGETWGRNLATLVGDAAHPTTPALGQGGAMALEDGPELAAVLRDAARAAAAPWAQVPAADLERALRGFEHRRSTRCAPLVAQARQNGRRLLTKRTWLGVLIRDSFIRMYAMNPATQFKHTIWTPPSLNVPAGVSLAAS